jgi:hypothetical protein
MVISAYDEAVTVTTPNVGSGTRARPIVLVPTGSATFAGGKPAGSVHLFAGRAGIRLQSGSSFIAIMGIDFQQPQKNPSDPAYVGQVNLTDVSAVDVAGGMTGLLVEDVHSSWGMDGVSVGDQSGNFDIVIRRNQIDHCYAVGAGHPIGASIHNVGTSGGALAGYSFEENVIDLCGYPDPTGMFAFGDSRSRNAYFQGNTAFGNRRGNTSTRSGSESFQFRSGGDIDNNFTYNGLGLDVGHKEGEPTLTSSTVVHNNVTVLPITPFGGGPHPTGLNFANSNNVTASNNLIAHVNDGSALFAATDNYDGGINALTTSNAGTGGAPGNYGCIGGTDFTGGHGTNAGTFNLVVGAGGSITGDPTLQEPNGNEFFAIGDVLTPVANYPSLQTSGTTITAANSGATVGTYGTPFGICPDDPAAALPGFAGGIALTNFSGSMAGSEARATFVVDNWSSITRFMDSGSGLYFAQANANNAFVDFGGSGAHSLNVGSKILVSGVTPSAYNGTWTVTGINQPNGTAIWSLGTMTDPGPVTVLGSFTGYTIIQTGKNYVAGDVLTASFGGGTGLRITVNSVAHLSGWTETVSRILSAGTHALTFTGNTVFNWIGVGPPSVGDDGGTHDSPSPGGAGTGAANIWTPNTICPTAQFTGVITGTNTLTTSALVQGTIAIGQSLAGPGVSPSTTITGGSGTSWTVSPNQTAPSATMYSYTCAPTTVFSAPYRTVQTYAASLGLTASIDGYMTAALANAKWNWTQNLTAAALNHYIRQGYGMTP